MGKKRQMTRIILVIIFITTLTRVSGQVLGKFEFSDCMRECIGDSTKINSVTQTNKLTKINLTAYAPCNGNLEGQIKLTTDTLDLKYSTKTTIVVNKKTGEVTKLLEIADCDCIFKFNYTIKGLQSLDKNKIKINGETLDKINKRNFSYSNEDLRVEDIKIEFENDTTKTSEDIFLVVDNPAQFPGGFAKLYIDYIDKNLKYPNDAREEGIRGKVFVEFVINIDGSIDDTTVRAVKGLNESCNNEAIRLMQECPDWTPATMKGNPVKQRFVLPITFGLSKDK